MRSLCLVTLLVFSAPAVAQEKSALETSPDGWLDLMPGKDLKGWKRVALFPDTKLADKNPWSVEGNLLLCDGVGIKEMLIYDKEFGDGVFHTEWRFRPVTGDKKDYNGGLYIRSKADGKIWSQIQVAHLEKPPFVGDIFGDKVVGDKLERYIIRGEGTKRVKTPGEWNTMEVSAKGSNIAVWLNGGVVTTWNECPLPRGYLGMQAEFFFLEFRNLKFKEAR